MGYLSFREGKDSVISAEVKLKKYKMHTLLSVEMLVYARARFIVPLRYNILFLRRIGGLMYRMHTTN